MTNEAWVLELACETICAADKRWLVAFNVNDKNIYTSGEIGISSPTCQIFYVVLIVMIRSDYAAEVHYRSLQLKRNTEGLGQSKTKMH
jgi:hypothetical protein